MEEPTDSSFPDFEDYSFLLTECNLIENVSPNHESFTQSQYAKVVFRDIADSYPTDADVSCHYSLTSSIEVQVGDFVGLFRVGWNDVNEVLLKHSACSSNDNSQRENGGLKVGQVLFRADTLPKNDQEFYQLCYVTAEGCVCGASVPFQFRRPSTEELCAIEGESEMVVVRSRTAVAEEKVREVEQEREKTRREKVQLETELKLAVQQLTEANTKNEELTKELEISKIETLTLQETLLSGKQRERQYQKMQHEMQSLDEEKNQTIALLRRSQQNEGMLNATIETLSDDKTRMAGLLRESVNRGDELLSQLKETQSQLKETQSELKETQSQLEETRSQLYQTRSQLQQAYQKIDMLVLKHQKEITSLEAKHKDQLAELHQTETEVKSDLLKKLAQAQETAQSSERQKKDLGLLREHRATLERQLEIVNEKHQQEKTAWRARELDLVGRIGLANQQLSQLRQQQESTAQQQVPLQCSTECNQCEAAGIQLSLLDVQLKDLQSRLSIGAEEYRKIYREKSRVEKKLARSTKQDSPIKHDKKKIADVHSAASSSNSAKNIENTASSDGFNHCPLCEVSFPPGSNDLFAEHFENHLS